MTITMEVGDIKRFQTPGDLASYCRTVDSKRLSNGKKKGKGGKKRGG
jgi:transposase